jgi:cysteine desulfuration protein SufE
VSDIPEKLQDLLETFAIIEDRQERIQLLIDMAEGFRPVPESIAKSPFPEEARVPACESEAFVFTETQPNNTLRYHFAVENPQGISAMATAVIIDKTCSGAPPEKIVNVPADVIYDIFGRELSMGKNMGLTNMLNMCKVEAAKCIARHSSSG